MARPKIADALRAEIRVSARSLCEYCHTDETWQHVPFTIDHIVPLSLGGSSARDNLALACFHCNRRKGASVRALDPEMGREVPLFHPRTQAWRDHFAWSEDGVEIIALTPTGRATLHALDLNRERVLRIRGDDVAIGRHPPEGDPIYTEES